MHAAARDLCARDTLAHTMIPLQKAKQKHFSNMVVVAGLDGSYDATRAIGRTVVRPPRDPGTNPLQELHIACRDGDKEKVEQLLEAPAVKDPPPGMRPLEALAKFGWTPLIFAARHGHPDIVTMLVDAGAFLHAKDHSGSTAMHSAAFAGSVKTIETLLDLGSPIDPVNKRGQTPLHVAASNGCLPAAKCLIKRGASPKSRDGPLTDGMLPEEVAEMFHEEETADFLRQTLKQFYVDVQRASVSSDPKAKAWLTLMMSKRE